MKSDFEKSAAQAAVDAVEARWRRNQDLKKRAIRRQRMRSFTACALLVAMALAVGIYLRLGDDVDWMEEIKTGFATLRSRGRMVTAAKESLLVDRYGDRLKAVLNAPVRLGRDLPSGENPRRAPAGTAFSVLSANAAGQLQLHVLTADGKGGLSAMRCSPFAPDGAISTKAFASECRKPYLIKIGETAYLCGSQDLKAAERLKSLASPRSPRTRQ